MTSSAFNEDVQTRPNGERGDGGVSGMFGDAAAAAMPMLVTVINRIAAEAARRSDPFLPGIIEAVESTVMYVAGTPTSRYGHFMTEAWRNEHGRSSEIVLNAAHLDRPAENVMTTLLHEMAHAFANDQNIPDTSRDGRYHNRRFGELAVQLGAHIVKDPQVGLRTRGLTVNGRDRYGDLLCELAGALTLVRDPVRTVVVRPPTEPRPAPPTMTATNAQQRKYVFPVCRCLDRRGRREVAGRIAVGKWVPGKLLCTACGSPLVDPDSLRRSLDTDPEAA